MSRGAEPVVLELASLPREQMGAFLILGLDKAVEKPAVERNWADRVKWARRNLIKVPLEDINWAREMLGDEERRLRADAGSLNVDATEGLLATLARRFGLSGGQTTRMWQALDCEKALAEYNPPAEVPDAEQVRAAITPAPPPDDVPAAPVLLAQQAARALDPWAIELPGVS